MKRDDLSPILAILTGAVVSFGLTATLLVRQLDVPLAVSPIVIPAGYRAITIRSNSGIPDDWRRNPDPRLTVLGVSNTGGLEIVASDVGLHGTGQGTVTLIVTKEDAARIVNARATRRLIVALRNQPRPTLNEEAASPRGEPSRPGNDFTEVRAARVR